MRTQPLPVFGALPDGIGDRKRALLRLPESVGLPGLGRSTAKGDQPGFSRGSFLRRGGRSSGRLWVLATWAYPQLEQVEIPNDNLLILRDTYQDGRADKTTRFPRTRQGQLNFYLEALYRDVKKSHESSTDSDV